MVCVLCNSSKSCSICCWIVEAAIPLQYRSPWMWGETHERVYKWWSINISAIAMEAFGQGQVRSSQSATGHLHSQHVMFPRLGWAAICLSSDWSITELQSMHILTIIEWWWRLPEVVPWRASTKMIDSPKTKRNGMKDSKKVTEPRS